MVGEGRGWELRDCATAKKEHPYTFYKPSDRVLERIHVGSLVKLIFELVDAAGDGPTGERMWVEITRIEEGRYRGLLRNKPQVVTALDAGEEIEFEAHHIADTEFDEVEFDPVEAYLKRCFVTQRVLRDGEPVRYLYREEPDDESDSGWRLMAGDESQEYMDDSGNIAYVSLGAILNRDDSFVGLLDAPAGSAFRRCDDNGGFRPVP